ncbi:hypothetical protein G6F40_015469 [Rhizopus arrhizus]|nr:hypothetical protein G6F40_015469 [Rhizopus arrhizus]
MRPPLGITLVGGLVLSQILPLYTTPVVYLYLDRFRLTNMIRIKPLSNAFLPRSAVTLALCALLGACAVGPDYQRPELDVGASYKEGQGQDQVEGWKPAEPRDDADRGQWWRVYGDATLNGLVDRLNTSNQTIAPAAANYRQALGLVLAAPATARTARRLRRRAAMWRTSLR